MKIFYSDELMFNVYMRAELVIEFSFFKIVMTGNNSPHRRWGRDTGIGGMSPQCSEEYKTLRRTQPE